VESHANPNADINERHFGRHAAELRITIGYGLPLDSPAARYAPAARRLARVRW